VVNLRTVYRGFTFENTQQNYSVFTRDDAIQSAGVGIAVTRDIFLYPNIQWVWAQMNTALTNVALTAYINL
jgi:hypothetical protein